MSHSVIKFKTVKLDGEFYKTFRGDADQNISEHEAKAWHLVSTQGDGENTACGQVYSDYDYISKSKEKGGVTCEDCLDTIKYFKSIKL